MTTTMTQNSTTPLIKSSSDPSKLGELNDKELDEEEARTEERIKVAVATKEQRKKDNLCKSYFPNGKATEFIKMVGSDKHFVNFFIGANSTSKTATGVNILANICYGPQNEYFEHTLFEKFPYPIKRIRIISDPTTIKEKIIPELQKWFPTNDASKIPDAPYETAKEGKNYVSKIRTSTGWEIDLMSNEQDTKEFESVDLSVVWIDEPMPKDRFLATIARGRLGMIIIWTLTPLTYSAWIKDWLDANQGELADYVEAEMEDNCIKHGVRGIMEHVFIKRMHDSFPEDEREARVYGKFGHLIGRVHKSFRRKVHVIPPFPLDPKRYTTYMALDPHPRTPDHVLYMSVDSKGTKYISGELVSSTEGSGGVRELYERIKAFETLMKYRMDTRIIDPAGYIDDQHNEKKSLGSQLHDLNMIFIKGSKDLMAGIKRTNDALNYTVREGKMIMPPELYIFDTCNITVKQLDEYVWQEFKGPSKDDKKPSGRPKDVNDHQVENLHRLLLHEPVFVPYQSAVNPNYRSKTYEEELADYDPYEKALPRI